MEKTNIIGNRLSALIKEANMEQQEVAEQLGIKRSTFNGYVNNSREPSAEILKSIARFFDVSVDYLVGYSDLQNPYLSHLSTELGSFINDPENIVYIELAKDIKSKTVVQKVSYLRSLSK